jgi:hypothetical protein
VPGYDRTYGTDWTELERDEALDRAYALGVAAALGDDRPEEYEAVRETADGAYDRSVIELAYEEGRTAGREADPGDEPDRAVWAELVEGQTVVVEEPPTGGRSGLPEAVELVDALDRPEPGRNRATDRPEFLDRD